MTKFVNEGKALLDEPLFVQMHDRLDQFNLMVDLLVVGHQGDGGYIFGVKNPGADEAYAIPGFHAIGSGTMNAIASLSHRKANPALELAETLYYVYEAKQYAQLTGGVGETTDMFILRDRLKYRLEADDFALLKSIWDQVKPKDLTPSLLGPIVKKEYEKKLKPTS